MKINGVNHLYLIIKKLNGYFQEINKNKFSTLDPTNGSKEKIKKYEELWSKIRDLIRSKNYMKIKFNLDEQLPLTKILEVLTMTIVVRGVFHENNKYYF